MNRHLIVTEAFDGLAKGARIEDAERVREILAGPHAALVVSVRAPPPAGARKGVKKDAD